MVEFTWWVGDLGQVGNNSPATDLIDLRHAVSEVGVGGGLGEDRPHAEGNEGLPQAAQEVLHHPSQRVHVVVVEGGAATSSQKLRNNK